MVIAWKDSLLIPEAIKCIRTSHAVTIPAPIRRRRCSTWQSKVHYTQGDLVALLLEYGSSCDRDVIVRYLERCLPTFKVLVEAYYES
jgi:hypothetical protein